MIWKGEQNFWETFDIFVAVAIGTVTVKDYDEGDELNVTLLENADGRLNLKPPRCSSVAVGFKNTFHC